MLPLELPLEVGDALLVPRQYEHAPQTLQLLAELRSRLQSLAGAAPELVVLDGVPRFQERCHPSDQYIRGLEDMTNASLQRGC